MTSEKLWLGVLVAISFFLSAASANAQSCSGNACSDIQLQKHSDGCMAFHNSGSSQVKIEHHVGGVSVGVAYPSDSSSRSPFQMERA